MIDRFRIICKVIFNDEAIQHKLYAGLTAEEIVEQLGVTILL